MTNKKFNQGNFLKFAAVVVAAPRLLGWALISVGYVPIGEMLSYLHWFEGVAGIALAFLEGLAIAFIFAKWRLVKRSTLDFWSLTFVLLSLVATFIFVSTPYLYFMQVAPPSVVAMFAPLGQPLATIVQILWCAASISASILVVVGVGMADVDELERERKLYAFELEKSELSIESERKRVAREVAIERIRTNGSIELERIKQQARLELKRMANETSQRRSDILSAFVCPYCERGFDSQNGLNGHIGHCQAKVSDNGNGKVTKAEQMEVVA